MKKGAECTFKNYQLWTWIAPMVLVVRVVVLFPGFYSRLRPKLVPELHTRNRSFWIVANSRVSLRLCPVSLLFRLWCSVLLCLLIWLLSVRCWGKRLRYLCLLNRTRLIAILLQDFGFGIARCWRWFPWFLPGWTNSEYLLFTVALPVHKPN